MNNVPIMIICAFSILCAIALYNISPNIEEAASGILGSVVAAFIFFLLTDRLPHYMKRKERAQNKYVAYRNLQLFLIRLDDVFFSVYCTRYGIDFERFLFKEIEKRMELRDFYDVSMVKWMDDVTLRPRMCHEESPVHEFNLKEYVENDWEEAIGYAKKILSSTYVNRDAKLEYLLSHIIFDHSVNVLFRMMKKIQVKHTVRVACYLLYAEKLATGKRLFRILFPFMNMQWKCTRIWPK